MSQKKAAITVIGTFDATGRPTGWEFDRNVRINEADDGTWTMGGYTKEELEEIVKNKAVESGEEVKETKPIVQTPAPIIFKFRATIVGVQAKKPPKLPVHKEIKLLSVDVDELSAIDKRLESEVEVMIIKRDSTMKAEEFFEHFKEKFDSEDATAEPDDEGKTAAGDKEPGESELDLSEDAESVDKEQEPPADPGAPAVESPAAQCEKCGADLAESEDATQLICSNPDCGEVYVNTAEPPADFE